MKTTKDELIEVLDALSELLNSDGEQHWAAWMTSAKRDLMINDIRGLDKLLSAYGGMGSFNDLVVGQRTINGRFEWKPKAQELNGRLEVLRNKAYDLGMILKRSDT